MSMEGRMTVCNLSIEWVQRGLISPDKKTIEYVKNREYTPKGKIYQRQLNIGLLFTLTKELFLTKNITLIQLRLNQWLLLEPIQGWGLVYLEKYLMLIQKGNSSSYLKSLKYMGYEIGDKMLGKKLIMSF